MSARSLLYQKFLISKGPPEAVDKERKNRESLQIMYFSLCPYGLSRELIPYKLCKHENLSNLSFIAEISEKKLGAVACL